jgi:hypothetical protein
MNTKKYKIKEINYVRIFAYTFMVLLFILSTVNVIITVPNIIYNTFNFISGYDDFFILKSFSVGLLIGLVNVFILYKISSTNPLEVASESSRKKIRIAVYVINTLMFLFLTFFLTFLIFIDIEGSADLISDSEEYSILMFIFTNSLIASITVNFTLFSISLKRDKK